MKGTGILLLASSFFAGVCGKRAVKQRSAFAVKDAHNVPRNWENVGQPEPDHTITLRIGLKQGSFAELERHLCEWEHDPLQEKQQAVDIPPISTV